MMTGAGRFNTYLLLVALLSSGCKTAEERRNDKSVATFRLHLETDQASTGSAGVIEIAGAQLSVSNVPFLDETSVTNAAVVDTRDGGFAMQVQYDRHGTLVLDSVTTEYRGRHVAIFTQFGTETLAGRPLYRFLAYPRRAPLHAERHPRGSRGSRQGFEQRRQTVQKEERALT